MACVVIGRVFVRLWVVYFFAPNANPHQTILLLLHIVNHVLDDSLSHNCDFFTLLFTLYLSICHVRPISLSQCLYLCVVLTVALALHSPCFSLSVVSILHIWNLLATISSYVSQVAVTSNVYGSMHVFCVCVLV